jgi:hypothetical protein
MMDDRNYIIERLVSRSMSKEEFNFEKLTAPPINWIFTPQDLYELHNIATSLRYSAQPQVKYDLIDQIMVRRGFEKFQAGTNRVTYRFLEDQSFVAKVAYSKQSCKDNLREFENQHYLKPFVTKVFEVTPDGVLGFFERVKPINSREEFISVADDIFFLLTEFIIGEYVLDDIGVNNFMNYGIRVTHGKGGGPVLLDFPYMYKLDGNKIFCNAPNEFSPTGRCDGEIDYDDGFNKLRCCKCGAEYKAYELKKAEEKSMITLTRKGGTKMKITVSGGNGADRTITTGDNEVQSTPKKPIKKSNEVELSVNGKEVGSSSGIKIHTIPAKEVKKPEPEDAIEFDPSLIVQEMQVKDERPKEVAKEDYDPTELSALVKFCDYIEKAWTILNDAYVENHYKVDEFMDSLLAVYRENRSSSGKYLLNDLKAVFLDYEFIDIEDEGDPFDDDKDSEFVNILKNHTPSTFLSAIFRAILGNNINDYSLDVEVENGVATPVINIIYQGEDNKEVSHFSIFRGNSVEIEASDEPDDVIDDEEVEDNEETSEEEDGALKGFECFAGTVINIKDLFPETKRKKSVVVIIGPDGEYLTVGDNKLLAIDKLDNRQVNNLSIVARSVYEKMKTQIEMQNDETMEVKEAPTGAVPPEEEELGVNGVVTEE